MATNRQRLQAILGNNPTNNCAPQNRIPARIRQGANQERQQITRDRYGNFLNFVQGALSDLTNLPTAKIQMAISDLANWLGNDDPLGLFHSLENGQLLNLLGEIAPVIAQWFSENLGLANRGGRQSRKGGYRRITNQSANTFPSFESILALGENLAPYLQRYGGSIGIGSTPSSGTASGGSGGGNPIGEPDTIEVPDNSGNPPNVLEIPGNDGGDGS